MRANWVIQNKNIWQILILSLSCLSLKLFFQFLWIILRRSLQVAFSKYLIFEFWNLNCFDWTQVTLHTSVSWLDKHKLLSDTVLQYLLKIKSLLWSAWIFSKSKNQKELEDLVKVNLFKSWNECPQNIICLALPLSMLLFRPLCDYTDAILICNP